MTRNPVIVSSRSIGRPVPIEDRLGEGLMLVADILHSCTDEAVAGAAVASIGGDFAAAMRAEATRSGITAGALTVSLVSRFAVDATERDWRQLTAAMAGEDHPVLSGLRTIAERMLARRELLSRHPGHRRDRVVAPPAFPVPASLCSLA